jgi:hypothetical protein
MMAGVGPANVSKVKFILSHAHPRIIDALKNGAISIHRASGWCALTKTEQVEKLAGYEEERAKARIISKAILEPTEAVPSPAEAIQNVQRQHTRNPGSVEVRVGRFRHSFIVLGEELHEFQYPEPKVRLA